jgi:hypothetical protein
MKQPHLKNRRVCRNYPLRPVPIIVASLLLIIVGIVSVAGQLVTIPFTVNPSAPTADHPLTFSFDASNVRGKVVGIVILAGSRCSPATMIVTTLAVSPTVASGSVSLPSGLGTGQYVALAFITISGTSQSVTEIASCLPFTVS